MEEANPIEANDSDYDPNKETKKEASGHTPGVVATKVRRRRSSHRFHFYIHANWHANGLRCIEAAVNLADQTCWTGRPPSSLTSA